MSSVKLTDRYIKSLRSAAPGRRYDCRDVIVPGLALRVTDRGHKSFVLCARYPRRPKNPTRRALGDYGALTLEDARAKARHWIELIDRGVDPASEEEREKAAAQRLQAHTFASVAADFLDRHGTRLAKAQEVNRIINGEFVKRWSVRPITDIEPREIPVVIRAIAARAPYQAHNAFALLRRLYSWAIATGEYGVETSPTDRLRPAELIGRREARARVLSDSELRAVWHAASTMGYPYGPAIRILILTGQRLREVADMSWSEVDLNTDIWLISAARMKGDAAHEVPLSRFASALLASLPRWSGDFVFSTTDGRKPVNGFSKAKARIDKISSVMGWVLHDLRRTMRTHLSALPVEDLVRELVIAHAKPGLHKVYDRHLYRNEKRRCLELWEARLLALVEPRPGDIADLTEARERRRAER